MFSFATAKLTPDLVNKFDSRTLASEFIRVEQECCVKFNRENGTFSITGEWGAINKAHELLLSLISKDGPACKKNGNMARIKRKLSTTEHPDSCTAIDKCEKLPSSWWVAQCRLEQSKVYTLVHVISVIWVWKNSFLWDWLLTAIISNYLSVILNPFHGCITQTCVQPFFILWWTDLFSTWPPDPFPVGHRHFPVVFMLYFSQSFAVHKLKNCQNAQYSTLVLLMLMALLLPGSSFCPWNERINCL